MREIICTIILFVLCLPAAPAESVPLDGPVVLENKWIHVSVSPSDAGRISQFKTVANNVLWPQDGQSASKDGLPGCNLILYAGHPLSTTSTIPLPQKFDAKTVTNDFRTQLFVQSTDQTAISIKKEFLVSNIESTLSATTTITNTQETPLTFYPTELIHFNSGIDRGKNMANMNCYFYSPCRLEPGERGYEVSLGLAKNAQFFVLPKYEVFYLQYKNRIGEVRLTNPKNWIAVQNLISRNRIDGGTVCAIEYRYPGKKPQPVEKNLTLYTNGAGEFIQNGRLARHGTHSEQFVRVTYVLGRVQLKPGESWTYSACWNASRCIGPIIDVQNGVVFNKRYDVYFHPNGHIENYVDMGIPQEGTVAVQHIDETGKVFNTLRHPLSLYNPLTKIKRPPNAVPYWPTILFNSSNIMTPEDLRGPDDTKLKLLQDKVKKIRLILVDPKKRPIRFLDEAEAPFKVIPPGGIKDMDG